MYIHITYIGWNLWKLGFSLANNSMVFKAIFIIKSHRRTHLYPRLKIAKTFFLRVYQKIIRFIKFKFDFWLEGYLFIDFILKNLHLITSTYYSRNYQNWYLATLMLLESDPRGWPDTGHSNMPSCLSKCRFVKIRFLFRYVITCILLKFKFY